MFHRKERDILSLLISLRKASLLFTALSKKALKFCASVFWQTEWIKSLTSHSAIELKRALFVPCFIRTRARSNPTSAYRRFRHENLAQLWNCFITLLAIFFFSRAYWQWDIKGQTKTIVTSCSSHPSHSTLKQLTICVSFFANVLSVVELACPFF